MAMSQQLDVYAGGGYNELILEWDGWVRRLPGACEALFVRGASNAEQQAEAHRLRAAFLREYGLGDADGPPLVLYDEARDATPFSLLDPAER